MLVPVKSNFNNWPTFGYIYMCILETNISFEGPKNKIRGKKPHFMVHIYKRHCLQILNHFDQIWYFSGKMSVFWAFQSVTNRVIYL